MFVRIPLCARSLGTRLSLTINRAQPWLSRFRNSRATGTTRETRRTRADRYLSCAQSASRFLSWRASIFARPVIWRLDFDSARSAPLGGYRLRALSQSISTRGSGGAGEKTETIFVRNQVERMILPTMKSTTSTAMAAGKRSGEKRRDTPVKPEVNKDLCRVVFLRSGLFLRSRRSPAAAAVAAALRAYMRSDRRSHRARSSIA